MDIKQLKYFLSICKNSNFTDTAKMLFITQQGLSKAIKSLEDELNLPLFRKVGNKIELTKYGIYLKEKSIPIVQEFDELKNSIEEMSCKNEEEVKIGYSLGVISAFSYEFISHFKKKYPDVKLNITEYQDFMCEEAVMNEKVDVGFTIGPVDQGKFYFETIIKKRMSLLVNERNKLLKKRN